MISVSLLASSPDRSNFVDLDVTVKKIARNVFQPYGPVMSPLGDMALLSSEHVDIAICTRRNQTFHADAFRAVGAEPADYRVVIVKSAQHFSARRRTSFATSTSNLHRILAVGSTHLQ